MTIVRLPSGGLLLHSPVPIDEPLAAQLTALGNVEQIVAPSLLHHLFAGRALNRFPTASLHGAPGLAQRRSAAKELQSAHVLGDEPPEAWRAVLDQHLIKGAPRANEVVFLHRPSRTLIVSDLLFNITRPEGWATKLLLSMTGTRGRCAQSRVWRLYARDRAAVRASVRHILAWDFDRLIVGHGEILATGAKEVARQALWIARD